jgi:hypothetical protein
LKVLTQKEQDMKNRGQLALGVILILLGGLFIAQMQIPAMRTWMDLYMKYPLNIVAAGAGIFLVGLLLGAPSMSIPAAIVAGVGGILYYQTLTEDPTVWSYMWTLIIGSVGVGEILTGLLSRNMSQARSGANTIVVSAVLFVIFAAIFGKLNLLGAYGPAIVLILVGIWVFVRGLWRKGQ